VIHILFELIVDRGPRLIKAIDSSAHHTLSRRWGKKSSTASLNATIFEFCSTELTSGCGLLLQHLLFVGVRVTNLNDVLLATWLADRSVVELLDNFLTNVTSFEAKE
jgi:hypothetical protein